MANNYKSETRLLTGGMGLLWPELLRTKTSQGVQAAGAGLGVGPEALSGVLPHRAHMGRCAEGNGRGPEGADPGGGRLHGRHVVVPTQ